jgi:thiamine monophosphate kinase
MLHGGEEYELILVGPQLPEAIAGTTLTQIGEIVDSGLKNEILLIDGGQETVLQSQGWQHF